MQQTPTSCQSQCKVEGKTIQTVTLSIDNLSALSSLEIGRRYYVTFQQASATEETVDEAAKRGYKEAMEGK